MIAILAVIGRVAIAVLFIVSGIGKLFDVAGTQGMIASAGLPAQLALPVGLFELIAGLALVFGVLTRLFAVLLAAFCLAAALFFHNNLVDPVQSAMFLKNLAIAGGLLCLTAADTARWSYDALRARRRADLAALDAERETHDADVRSARAEGVAAATRTREATGSHIQGRTVVVDTDGDGVPDERRGPPV